MEKRNGILAADGRDMLIRVESCGVEQAKALGERMKGEKMDCFTPVTSSGPPYSKVEALPVGSQVYGTFA